MKKTYFITMITAALMGSAYANTNYTANPGTHSSPPENVYGTYADPGEASGASVRVFEVETGGYEYIARVRGGLTYSGNAANNTVTMEGGEVRVMYGGYVAYNGDAAGNTVTVTGGQVPRGICGGHVGGDGDAYENTVTMSDCSAGTSVVGGTANTGKATKNTVSITRSTASGTLYGGYSVSGDATYNAISITDTNVQGVQVYGGYTSSTSAASYNTVNITGGQQPVRNVYGGLSEWGAANGNTINLNSASVGIEGEDCYITGGSGRSAKDNTVNLYDCESMYVFGGEGTYGDVNGNTVNMIGGSARQVYGGSGDYTSNNTVRLIGEGAKYTIGDTTYQGSSISVDDGVYVGWGEGEGNAIHIHGTGINIGDTIEATQLLTFHLVDAQAGGAAAPMVTLGSALDLNGVELGFYGDAVTDWAAFEGKSITLVSMTSATITGLIVPSNPVDILDAGGTVLATASMVLSDDAQTLSLQFASGHTSYTANPGSPQTSAPDSIFGAYSETGDVTGGSAGVFEVESGGYESLGNVYGGYAKSGNVSDCSADMTGGQVGFDVYGGYVHDTGNATDNTVTMNGGEVRGDVNGGYTTSGDATGNTVDMTGGQVGIYVYGGRVLGTGDATGNTVNMNGGKVGYDVYGGNTYSGDATGNTVDMTGGQVGNVVYGGVVLDTGDATENAVTINDAYVDYRVYGGFTKSGNANGNIVNMADGQVGSEVYGGHTSFGDATGNTVTIAGGYVDDNVFGGCTSSGDVTDNTVDMTGVQVGNVVYGGYVWDTGDATGNTVTMSGGEVGHDVVGGWTYSGNATGNTVHLVGEGASYTVGDTTYKGDKVAIQGNVRAGYVVDGGVSSNNSVHIHGTGASIGGTIDSCQMLTFHLAQGQADGAAAPMVTLGGALDLEGVELGFYGDAVTDWAAFNGKSVTLVGMTNKTITGLVTPTDPVDITDEGGKTVATATLTLSDEGKALTLTNIQGVGPVPPPVPTAGPNALDVALVNSLWASSAYVREFVRLSGAQGYALKDGDTAVWGGGFGTFMHATGNRGFKSDGGGYGIGVNHAFSANTQAGISFGQGFGSYHNSGADGATVHQRAILAAATASTRITKDFSLDGHLAFGNVRNRADCRLDGESGRARWNDNVFNLGARAAYDFHVTETTAITPFLGLDWMNGAHESFGGAYGRHYSHGRLNELRMPVGVTVSTATEVGSTKLLPQLSVAYVPSLAQQLPHADVSGENGDYRVKGYAPGRNAFMLNVGVNAVFSDSWSAGAFYTLETRSHSVDQSVNASVRYTF